MRHAVCVCGKAGTDNFDLRPCCRHCVEVNQDYMEHGLSNHRKVPRSCIGCRSIDIPATPRRRCPDRSVSMRTKKGREEGQDYVRQVSAKLSEADPILFLFIRHMQPSRRISHRTPDPIAS